MTLNELTSAIAKVEGHKSESRIYDIREIVGIVADMIHNNPDVLILLLQSGMNRAKRKKKSSTPQA